MLSILRTRYTPDTLPYHVIVPSLPGYTLSRGPLLDRDFSMEEASQLIHELMIRLGFKTGYVAQGGDVGSILATFISARYEECKAVHGKFLLFQSFLFILATWYSCRHSELLDGPQQP